MSDFLVSIVLPTKDRPGYLSGFINRFIHDSPGNWALAIADNSVAPFEVPQHERVFYTREERLMPIKSNTEIAYELVNAEFYLFVGDDDFVNYDLDIESWKDYDIINGMVAYYWWKDIDKFREFHSDQLSTRFIRRSDWSLNSFLKDGASDIFKLPWLYHGLVKKNFLIKIKREYGCICLGPSPDISLALQSALLQPRCLFADEFLTVFGASQNSGGGMTANNTHRGSLKKPWLPNNLEETWPEWLPMYWSQHTIYPYTAHLLGLGSKLKVFTALYRCFKYDGYKPNNLLLKVCFNILLLSQILIKRKDAEMTGDTVNCTPEILWQKLSELKT